MDATKLRQLDTDHNAKVLGLLNPGQTYKTWCYVAQKYATVIRIAEGFSVKIVGKAQTMTLDAAVEAIVNAHQGKV
jgi:hypothetical protein